MTDTVSPFEDKYKDMTLDHLAEAYLKLKEKHTAIKAQAAEVWKEFDYLRFTAIVDKLEELNLSNAKIDGVGRVQTNFTASTAQLNKERLYQWLKENDHTSIIKESINSSTLTSFMKNQIASGEPIPDADVVRFTTAEYATVVKA